MTKCDFCGKEVDLPFKCSYCNGTYCSEHRLPENHICTGLLKDKQIQIVHTEIPKSSQKRTSSIKVYILFIIILIGVTGGVYKLSYDMGIAEGRDVGYLEGNSAGLETGFEQGYYDGYDKGYDTGYGAGYGEGYSNGTIDGKVEGYEEGYQTGYSSGNWTGFSIGNITGYSLGYDVGLKDGNFSGYEEGYILGLEAGVLAQGYTLRDPTYGEMLRFLRSDKTDKLHYIEGEFECRHFAANLIRNAFDNGFHCYYVFLDLKDGAHAIVAFNTTNQGLIYIEPQDDNIVKPKIGNVYWDRSKYIVKYDDTVLEILLIP